MPPLYVLQKGKLLLQNDEKMGASYIMGTLFLHKYRFFLNPAKKKANDFSMASLSFLHIIFIKEAIHASPFFSEFLFACIKWVRI